MSGNLIIFSLFLLIYMSI